MLDSPEADRPTADPVTTSEGVAEVDGPPAGQTDVAAAAASDPSSDISPDIDGAIGSNAQDSIDASNSSDLSREIVIANSHHQSPTHHTNSGTSVSDLGHEPAAEAAMPDMAAPDESPKEEDIVDPTSQTDSQQVDIQDEVADGGDAQQDTTAEAAGQDSQEQQPTNTTNGHVDEPEVQSTNTTNGHHDETELHDSEGHSVAVEVSHDRLTVTETINFQPNTATLLPTARRVLNGVARTIVHHPRVLLVEVAGHCSDSGSKAEDDAFEQRLSEERAAAVVTHLVGRGVARTRLIAKGYGDTRPVATNKTAEGRALNRRVEFVVLKMQDH